MNPRTRNLVLSAALSVSVLGAGTLAYGSLAPSNGSSQSTTRLVSASLGSVETTVSSTGTLAPATSLDLNFVNAGTLTAVSVKAGDPVTVGQVLARIDDAAAKADLGTAKANLLAAQAKLASARAGTTTTVVATPVVDPVAVAQAKAALDQAQLTVDDDQKALDATTLTAPVAGKIAALNFAVGQKVSGGGTAASSSSSSAGSSSSSSSSGSSKAFATLVDPTTMVVAVSWPESDAAKISVGQSATITVASLGTPVTGTVTALDTTSTVVSNVVTYAGTVTLDQVPDGLKSGMTATVNVVTASRSGVIAIPSAAITTKGGTSTVTVSQSGQSTSRTVTLGLKGDGTTEIASGLSAGDQVVMAVGTVSATAASSSSGSTSSRTGTGLGSVTAGGAGGGGFGAGPPGP
ncbi:MAG TPA: biotin/lipoyl-binding protein [Acidimicrobiia bacterium]|nr:biotin/lipoyl-binding protein [Acidimicrobiia bacterium]